MAIQAMFDSQVWTLVVIPILIFLCRVSDVTIGTIRIISIAKGMRYLAPALGFFEVLIWLFAIGQIMQNLTNPIHYLAFAGGFAMGNYVGIYVEHKLAMGLALVRAITTLEGSKLLEYLREKGYSVTGIDAEGNRGPVKVIFSIVKRKQLRRLIDEIHRFNPYAFYTVEDIGFVSEGALPSMKQRRKLFRFLGMKRK